MTEELTKQVCCIKYSLMACNAFGIMLGIMTVLFGMAYPEESFPGGYKGKETAGISAFFIVFTLIGYYGAHRQRIYFLIPYSIIIFLFLGGNLMMWSIKPEDSVLDPDSDAIKIIGSVFALVMVCALWLAWQERKKNLQLYGTTSVPRSMSNYFVNPNPYFGSSNINQQPMYQSTGQSVPPMYQQQPPMYQNPYQQQQQPQSFQMWDIDSKFNGSPVNLLYQPGSNSYISLERSQQPSLPPQYQQRDQQSSQSSQFDRQQQQMNQFDQRQARMDQQQQQSRMNGSIGQQQQQRGDGQSSSVDDFNPKSELDPELWELKQHDSDRDRDRRLQMQADLDRQGTER